MVLLARDTPAAAPGIKDLSIDMSQWQPLIEDRAFVSWLVKVRGCVPSGMHIIFVLRCKTAPQRTDRRQQVLCGLLLGCHPCTAVAINPVWLQAPGEQEVLRARHLSIHQVTKLEELWRSNPAASGALGCLGLGLVFCSGGVPKETDAASAVGDCGAPFPLPRLRYGHRGGVVVLAVAPHMGLTCLPPGCVHAF